MDYTDFKTALHDGVFDDQLDDIIKSVQKRRADKAPPIWDIEIGETVRITKSAKPKYLAGVEATVRKVNRTRIVIDLNEPRGRFHKNIAAPLSLVERI